MDEVPPGFCPCLSCTRSCYTEHWPFASRDSFRPPCFVKALCDSNLAAMATCWMVIPSAWLKLYGEEVGNSAILHGPSGNTWQVGVGRPKWVAFRVGWRTFAADNGLEKGDMLVFTLIAKSEFSVRIFDSRTCLEKESALTATNTGCFDSRSPILLGEKRKQRDDDENGAELKRMCLHSIEGIQLENNQSFECYPSEKVLQQSRPDVSTFGSADALVSQRECPLLDLNSQPSTAHQSSTFDIGKSLPEVNHHLLDAVVARTLQGYASGTVYQPYPISMHTQGVEEECNVKVQSKSQECGSGGLGPATRFASQRRPVMDATRERSSEFLHRQTNSSANITSQHRRQMLDLSRVHFAEGVGPQMLSPAIIMEREKVLELARRAQESIERPSHVVVLRAFHVHGRAFVRFPVTFGKQHMPRKTVPMHLLDSNGHRWPMTWLRDNETHMGLTRGWRDFCLAEGLLEGDVCIFELIESNKLTLLIHVFRSTEMRSKNQVIITKSKRPELLHGRHPTLKKCFVRRKVSNNKDGWRHRKDKHLGCKDVQHTNPEGQFSFTPTKLILCDAFHRLSLPSSLETSKGSKRCQDSPTAGSVGRERLKKMALWASKEQGGTYSGLKGVSCETETFERASLERYCKDDEELTNDDTNKAQDSTYGEILCQMSSGCVDAITFAHGADPGGRRMPTSTESVELTTREGKVNTLEEHGFEMLHSNVGDRLKKCGHTTTIRRREQSVGRVKSGCITLKQWAKTRKRCGKYDKAENNRTWGSTWRIPSSSVLKRRMQASCRNSQIYLASRRSVVTEAQKVAAKEAALALKTENPAALVVLKSSNVYKTHNVEFPSAFSRRLSASDRVHIFLSDAAGHKTKALLSQKLLTRGWRQFSLEHLLEEGDVCVFELIDATQLTVLVHIFRVVDVDHACGSYWNHYRIFSAGRPRMDKPPVNYSPNTEPNGQVIREKTIKSCQGQRNSVKRSLYLSIQKTRAKQRETWKIGENERFKVNEEPLDLNINLDPAGFSPPFTNTAWGSPRKSTATSCASRSPVSKPSPRLGTESPNLKDSVFAKQLCTITENQNIPGTSPSGSKNAPKEVCETTASERRQHKMSPEKKIMVMPIHTDEDDSEPEEGNYYRVVRILKKRYFKNEKQYLTELDGPVMQSDGCRGFREYDDMKWWISEKSFTPGFASCYLR